MYENRRAVTKAIPKFWPVALMNHEHFSFHVQHSSDQLALSYLEDLWIERDPKESRCYTIEFVRDESGVFPQIASIHTARQHFKENNFFADKVLKKEYKRVPLPAAAGEEPDEDGITESMLDFSWERDVKPSVRGSSDAQGTTEMEMGCRGSKSTGRIHRKR